MKKIGLVLAVLLMIVLAGSGCRIADSSDVNPNSIYPLYSVIQETGVSGIKVSAKLRLGGPGGVVVELNDGERLYCNNILLNKVHGLFDVTYQSTFYSSYPQYIFSFDREGESIDSYVGPLPAKPTIGTLPAVVNEGQGLNVQWDTSLGMGDEIMLFVVVDYTGNYDSWVLTDDGSQGISASTLYNLVKYYGPDDYTFRVEVARRDFYGVNAFFQKGGRGLAENIDVKTFTYHKTSLAESGASVLDREKKMEELKALKMGDVIK